MTQNIIKDARLRMDKSVEALSNALGKIRTGRAHISILDHIEVEYYGSMVPLSQVANLTVQDSRTLGVSPWEKPMVAAIEKAIINSDLGLNPATTGTLIRIPLPPLTEERRKDLVKVVGGEAEQAKVAVRNIRRDANDSFKKLAKEDVSEDEIKALEENAQKMTDKYIAAVDEAVEVKTKEILTV